MAGSAKIKKVWAREVLNFRGNPTVEAEVILSDGSSGRGAVAAGISAGINEVGALLDGDTGRFAGRGTLKAVDNVRNVIAPAIGGMDARDQAAVDDKMLEVDGTPNKAKLGGNAVLAVSLAVAKAAAVSRGLPLYRHLWGDGPFWLPVPAYDMLCGGSHAIEGGLDLQEYLIVPAGVETFDQAVQAGFDIYNALIALLRAKGHAVGQWGGPVSPKLGSNKEGMDVVAEAIEKAGYKLGKEVYIGLDAATSELYEDGKYVLAREGRTLSADEMADMWTQWIDEYPLVTIEDGMAEEDWDGWKLLTHRIGDRAQLVGDDFFTTNPGRIRRGISEGTANAVLIKPNQIGSVSETLETMRLAAAAGWATMPSERSGEAEDSVISDLAVAGCAGQIKTGPPCRQTVVKYNRLLRIEEELGRNAEYAGTRAFRTWVR
ncbi:MAG: phosphopyruvate hydratase [Spirochaetales bacterium]|nr:phosphopyruvate hydratase [Spirochaetales bacterium]